MPQSYCILHKEPHFKKSFLFVYLVLKIKQIKGIKFLFTKNSFCLTLIHATKGPKGLSYFEQHTAKHFLK